MSKDYLEALERLAMPDELHIKECKKLGIGVTEDFDTVEKALLELTSIKKANHSEALECLDSMYARLPQWDLSRNIDQYNTIKQALLKAQEPKHYLKWEDLEPFEEDKEIFGLLNGNKYILHTYRDSKHKYVLISLKSINMATLCDLFKQDIDFFNDLHLERVEE